MYSSHRFFYGKQFVQSFWLHSKWASSAVLCREFTLPLFLYLTLLRYLDSFWQRHAEKWTFSLERKTDWNSQPLFFKFPSFSKSSFLSFYYYYYHFSFSLSFFWFEFKCFFSSFLWLLYKVAVPIITVVGAFFFLYFYFLLSFLLFKMHFALVETAFLNKRN